MKKLTQKTIIENTGMSAKLARAAIKQFGDYDYFLQCAANVVNYGISGGFGGYIYHSDTVSFAEKHLKDILAFAKEQANDIGYDSLYAMFADFNCFKDLSQTEIIEALYDKNTEDRQAVMNGLSWYIGEEIARTAVDLQEHN
jgi:hypothetical protein